MSGAADLVITSHSKAGEEFVLDHLDPFLLFGASNAVKAVTTHWRGDICTMEVRLRKPEA